jgi:hypothetical protein
LSSAFHVYVNDEDVRYLGSLETPVARGGHRLPAARGRGRRPLTAAPLASRSSSSVAEHVHGKDPVMAGWTEDELSTIETTDELHISSRRADGSLRAPVTIWVVRVGDEVYVRSVRGRSGSWFRSARDHHRARVTADGVERDVDVVESDERADEIDTAYREKYRRYAANIVGSVVTPQARAATLKLAPR